MPQIMLLTFGDPMSFEEQSQQFYIVAVFESTGDIYQGSFVICIWTQVFVITSCLLAFILFKEVTISTSSE